MSRDELQLNIQLQPINIVLPPIVIAPPITINLAALIQPMPQLNLEALIPPAPVANELLVRTEPTLFNHIFNKPISKVEFTKVEFTLPRDVSQPGEKGFAMPGFEDTNDVDTATSSTSATTTNAPR